MVTTSVVVVDKVGLHARPAAELVRLATTFKSQVALSVGAKRVNAKSIIQVLTLGAGCGSQVGIEANGEDEVEALEALAECIRHPQEAVT